MDISRQDAKEFLNQIDTVQNHTRKSIASSYDSGLLILWGLIWVTAFIGTHFFVARAFHIWTTLCGIGTIITVLVCRQQFRLGNPTKFSAAKKLGWRIFWFWISLFAYIFIWLSILVPRTGIQVNAFIITTIMFAYIVIGIWSASSYMIWLGAVVTCLTLIGFYLIPLSYYCLWMAVTAGGVLLGAGLYLRFCWR